MHVRRQAGQHYFIYNNIVAIYCVLANVRLCLTNLCLLLLQKHQCWVCTNGDVHHIRYVALVVNHSPVVVLLSGPSLQNTRLLERSC